MTIFRFSGSAAIGAFDGAKRTVNVIAQSEEDWDRFLDKIGRTVGQVVQSLTTTIAHLDSGGSAAADHFANLFFKTGPVLMDIDRRKITAILVLTRNGLVNRAAVKVGDKEIKDKETGKVLPQARGWIHSTDRPITRPYHNKMAFLSEPGDVRRRSAIHISEKAAEGDDDHVRHTLVHEATHKFAGTEDHCYFHARHPYPVLDGVSIDKTKGLRNADSYAFFSNLSVLAIQRAQREGLPNPFA